VRFDSRGGETFPLLVIFGVLMAFLMAFVFISVYEQQMSARVDEEAWFLVEGLAQTAFQSLVEGESLKFDLPPSLGGSSYALEIIENSTFVVTITAGRRAGNTYTSVVGARLLVENSDFLPGGEVYFLRRGDELVVSSSELEEPAEEVLIVPAATPPEFYHFAKENPSEATGIAAVYFNLKEETPGAEVNIAGYRWENGDLLVKAIVDGYLQPCFKVHFVENRIPVGKVENVLTVLRIENVGEFTIDETAPSIENAYLSGWFYSPDAVLDHLRSRTWRRIFDNLIISIPADVEISAAAATTNVSTYPTWRVTFDAQVIIYRGMPWWELENIPGFIFQSSPELHPII
jgi:hypothetical protein